MEALCGNLVGNHVRKKLEAKAGGQSWRKKLEVKSGGQSWRMKLATMSATRGTDSFGGGGTGQPVSGEPLEAGCNHLVLRSSVRTLQASLVRE